MVNQECSGAGGPTGPILGRCSATATSTAIIQTHVIDRGPMGARSLADDP